MEHVHESPLVMLVPLLLLAVGAVLTGYIFAPLFIGEHAHDFWHGAIFNGEHNHILHAMHEVPEWVPLAPTVMGVAGIALAYLLYMVAPGIPGQIAARFRGVYLFLLNKWYFDELYDAIFVQPARRLAEVFWKTGDGRIIDGFGPDGISATVVDVTRSVVRLQTGYLYHYAFVMLIGVAALVTWMMLGSSF